MNRLKNSFELQETASLIGELLIPFPDSVQYDVFHDICPPDAYEDLTEETSLFDDSTAQSETAPPSETEKVEPQISPVDNIVNDAEYVGDKLENLLSNLCQQSGFQSAVVADEQGLPIGGYNTPILIDRLAAFSSILGTVIDKVPYFFEQSGANNISVDINYLDKTVVRKFLIGGMPFFLLIICSQDIDERASIELFSDQIVSVLER